MRTSILVPAAAALVVAAVVAIAAGPVYTALTAGAALVVGAGDSVQPGMVPHLDLVTIDERGVVTQSHDSPALIPLGVDDRYTPGRAFHLDLGVADNDPDTSAAVTVAVLPMDDEGAGESGAEQVGLEQPGSEPAASDQPGAPDLTPSLLVTVVDTTTGQVLIGGSASDPSRGAPVADASAIMDRLQPRDADPLADGEHWVAAGSGSRHDLDVTVYCPDTPAVRSAAGGRADLALMVYGTGVP